MTDPYPALQSFQVAHAAGRIDVQPGRLDRSLYVHVDHPNGTPRFTYVRIDGQTVTSMVEFVVCEPVYGSPCFNVGYAVDPAYRNQGLAKELLAAGIAELQAGFGSAGYPGFYVEAIVSVDNVASQKVAACAITPERQDGTDSASGVPIYQFLKKFETGH
jgi:GNAT superfamily N-acetyltransferase